MSRFELIVSSAGDITVSGCEGSFTRQTRVLVDGRVLDRHLNHHFAGPLADLLDVGMAAYAADRLCPRPRKRNRYDHCWHRRIDLTVPVRAPELWNEPTVRHRLQEVLAFLTEDEWTFDFVRHAAGRRETQGQLFDPRPRPPVATSLFSGGLDSLAGLGRDLQAAPDQVPFGIRHQSHSYNEDERTQRSRGFAHGLLGSAIAQLVRMVTGRPFRIELPCIFETKATMCRALKGTVLAKLVSRTVSCDAFPLRMPAKTQCGHCTSCVLRRQALKVAGLLECDVADPYRYDLHTVESWTVVDVTFPMSAMLYQVGRIQAALASTEPWYALSRTFPMLEQTALDLAKWGWNVDETRSGILRLYGAYCDEWDSFAQQSLTFAA